MVILDVAPNLPGAGRATNPVAGSLCYLGLAWGPGTGAAVSVTLSIAGATITAGAGPNGQQANVSTSPYAGQNLGWQPDGVPVYLGPNDAAYGIWQVTFPTAGSYTISLSGVGTTTITAINPASAPVTVVLQLLQTMPLGNLQGRVFGISFSGTYPMGGFPVYPSDLGLGTPFFAHINDTSLYRFVYDPVGAAIHVYGNAGEVSGAVTFTTTGLFQGSSQ